MIVDFDISQYQPTWPLLHGIMLLSLIGLTNPDVQLPQEGRLVFVPMPSLKTPPMETSYILIPLLKYSDPTMVCQVSCTSWHVLVWRAYPNRSLACHFFVKN